MMVLYGCWQQLYATVRCYTAVAVQLEVAQAAARQFFPPFAFSAYCLFPHLRPALTLRLPEYCLCLVVLTFAV